MAFGDFARLDEYGNVDPMTGMPIPYTPPLPTVRDALPSTMGALSNMHDYYTEANPERVYGAYDRATAKRRAFEALPTLKQEPLYVPSDGAPLEKQIEQDKELAKMFVPTSPMDLGLMAATGPLRPAAKFGALALGNLLDADPAEAGARDPRLWSPISATKLRKPLGEMEHTYTDVRNPVPKFVTPEELVGSYGIFTPWDLSATGKTLTHVDAQALERAVRLHGGAGFPEANPGMAAASEAPISRRLDNQAAELTNKTGKPVTIWPITMSPTGVDASHHVADPLSQLVQSAPVKTDDLAAFNEMMRGRVHAMEQAKKDPATRKEWVDTTDPGFQDYINNLKGGMKIKALMADRMGLAEWQAKGFPDVGAVRHAVSEPALIDQPRNTTGMAISRYIPGQGLLDTTHPSYPKGVAGQHMGQLASLIPFEAAAPSIAEALAAYNARNAALGKKVMSTPAYHLSKPHEGVPTVQYFDNEWADNIRRLWGDLK